LGCCDVLLSLLRIAPPASDPELPRVTDRKDPRNIVATHGQLIGARSLDRERLGDEQLVPTEGDGAVEPGRERDRVLTWIAGRCLVDGGICIRGGDCLAQRHDTVGRGDVECTVDHDGRGLDDPAPDKGEQPSGEECPASDAHRPSLLKPPCTANVDAARTHRDEGSEGRADRSMTR